MLHEFPPRREDRASARQRWRISDSTRRAPNFSPFYPGLVTNSTSSKGGATRRVRFGVRVEKCTYSILGKERERERKKIKNISLASICRRLDSIRILVRKQLHLESLKEKINVKMEFAFQKFSLQGVKCNNTAYKGNKLVDYRFIDSPKCNEQGEPLC